MIIKSFIERTILDAVYVQVDPVQWNNSTPAQRKDIIRQAIDEGDIEESEEVEGRETYWDTLQIVG